MKSESQPPIWLEVAAALLVPSACFGFARVFLDISDVLPLVGAALLSSAVAILARRLRVPLALSALLSLFLLTALIMNRYAPGTTRLGLIPTGATRDALRFQFDELVVNFQELKTPVAPLDPFVAAAMVGAWIMAFLTDWGAMRLRLAFEPVLPSALLFIFTSVPPISASQNRVLATAIFAAAIAGWAVTQRAANLLQRGIWLANDHHRGPAAIGRAGAVVAAVAVLAGAIFGGSIPGADAEPVYSFADEGDPTRVVVSPFVNIQSRLVQQTSVELFTVDADRPSYWRIAGLDTYEDDIWKVAGDFSPEDGRLPGERYSGGERIEVSQDYSITALAAIWLPAAFPPTEIVDASAEVTWNAENSSLTVANNVESSDGVDYSLLSEVSNFGVDELRAVPDVTPDDIAARYLGLPSDLSPRVLSLAQEITANETNRFDRVRAIQDHFQGYNYNVRLGPRTGDPIEQFLDEQEGFCQQFAGTMALMARALGIPARVATGFTWGDPVASDPATGKTTYSVTGRHTHAWPEVFFDGLGWVAFEPTPGRGIPGATNYTEVAARQSSDVQPDNPGLPTTTTAPIESDAGDALAGEPEIPEFDLGDPDANAPVPGGGGFDIPWRVLGVLALIGAYVGGIPALRELRRRRRRAGALTPSEKAETAWAEAGEALELGFELERRPAETRVEFAERLTNDRRVPADELGQLAEIATVARFHPTGVTDLAVDQADNLAEQIETAVKLRVPVYTRVRRMLDPRRLLKPSSRIVTETADAPPPKSPERELTKV